MMLRALLLAAVQIQAPAGAEPPAQEQAQGERAALVPLFLFFRASYFHDLVAAQRCRRAHRERTAALDARFEAARRRLTEQIGSERVQSPGTGTVDPRGDPDCRLGMSLIGYENAIHELEVALGGEATG